MTTFSWRISVKALVEFCCRRGDLGYYDVQTPRAEQGQMAQRRVQGKTPHGYRKEVPVEQPVLHEDITLTLGGRIDGLWEQDATLHLEEIKSTYYDDHTLPAALFHLHQAQAIVYAALLSRSDPFEQIVIRVTYFQLRDEYTYFREQCFSRADIEVFFNDTVADYGRWLKRYARHLQTRNAWCNDLAFPFSHYRKGQRALAVTAYRYLRDKKIATLEAATGAGKTVSLLFPAIKHFVAEPGQRIFYLTAKNSGQRSVMQTLHLLNATTTLFSVYLTAKSQLCPCASPSDTASAACTKCIGYYDRRRPALDQALQCKHLDRSRLLDIAEQHQVCPHQLALDMGDWADVIIGDFNYVFDPFTRQSTQHAFSAQAVLLVDEAHNLPERARAMFSCTLSETHLNRLLAQGPPVSLKKLLNKLIRLCRTPLAENGTYKRSDASLPESLPETLQKTLESLRGWMDEQAALNNNETLSQGWLTLLTLQRAFDHWGDHYRLLYAQEDDVPSLQALCLDPGYFLLDQWQHCAGALVFSGTLQPTAYFANILGLERLPSNRRGAAFSMGHALENTEVKAAIVPLPMQYRARQLSLPLALPFIQALLTLQPGRYMIAAASFDMLMQLHQTLSALLPEYHWLLQQADSTETTRQAFLNQFTGQAISAALVISGGIFAEGIDLADTPLRGVVQVGLPMPPPSEERKLLQDYFDHHAGQGFDYTYTYPAIARTLQTCGRLLRKDGDRGVLLLIDARYWRAPYVDFLPAHWLKRRTRTVKQLTDFLEIEGLKIEGLELDVLAIPAANGD